VGKTPKVETKTWFSPNKTEIHLKPKLQNPFPQTPNQLPSLNGICQYKKPKEGKFLLGKANLKVTKLNTKGFPEFRGFFSERESDNDAPK